MDDDGDPVPRGRRRRALARTIRQWAVVTVSALIMVVTSERVFWYYTDADFLSFAELAIFYGLGVAALFWFCHRYRVGSWWSLVAAAPVFAYVIEGVITPVLYSGGPTPVFPLWFSAWHGGLGVLLVWYGLRRLLLDRRTVATLVLAIALGVFWGTWATTMWLPENLDDPELVESAPRIRSLLDFARYATITSAVLAAGHWVLGRLWLADHRPSPRVARLLGAFCLVATVGYSLALPWATPMFVALVGSVAWMLRGRRPTADGAGPPLGPDLFTRLAGPVAARALLPLAALPAAAVASHGLWLRLDPSLDAVRVILYGTIALQSLVAAAGLVVAARRLAAERRPASVPTTPPTTGPAGRPPRRPWRREERSAPTGYRVVTPPLPEEGP